MRKAMTVLLLVCFMTTLALPDLLEAAEKPQGYSLAVLYLDISDARMTEADSRMLTERLSQELDAVDLFYTMPQPEVEQLLLDAGINPFDCNNSQCAVRAGRAVGSRLLIVGSVSETGRYYAIQARMIHVGSGEVVKSLSEEYEGDFTGLLDYMGVFARKFVGLPVRTGKPSAGAPAIDPRSPSQPRYERSGGGLNWAHLGLGLLIAGGVGAGVYFIQKESDGTSDAAPLDGPPSFP